MLFGLILTLVYVSLTTALIIYYFRSKKRTNSAEQATLFRLNCLANNSSSAVFIKDHAFRYVYVNQMLASYFQLNPSQMIGKTDNQLIKNSESFNLIRHHDTLALKQWLHAEEVLFDSSGHPERILSCIKFPVRNPFAAEDAIGGIYTDITTKKRIEAANHKLLFFERLTGLPNYHILEQRIQKLLQELPETKQMGAVLFININNFKHINEVRGYVTGNTLLQRFAQRIQQQIKPEDTVTRYSGDYFIVLLTQLGTNIVHSTQHATDITHQLIFALEQPFVIQGNTYLLQCSLGLAMIYDHTQTLEELTQEADMAMSYARKDNSTRLKLYQPSMRAEVEEYLLIETELSLALDSGQFQLYAQPQHDVSGRLVGCELLARWLHPEHGLISPSRFIPIAENSQLINKLGDWLIKNACLFIEQYKNEPFRVSINISPAQFQYSILANSLAKFLTRYQVPTERLVLEVTEGTLMNYSKKNIKLMQQLSATGLRFAIDDFGTGFSNLSALSYLPVAEIKIDRSLIQAIADPDSTSHLVVKSTIAIAKHLQLHVVAEGVEDANQLEQLKNMGCDTIQGYYFSKPLPLNEWDAYYKRCVSTS